jgi:hypothetical protein
LASGWCLLVARGRVTTLRRWHESARRDSRWSPRPGRECQGMGERSSALGAEFLRCRGRRAQHHVHRPYPPRYAVPPAAHARRRWVSLRRKRPSPRSTCAMSPSLPSTRSRAIGGLCSYALLTLLACRGGGPTRPAPGGVEPSVSASQAGAAHPQNASAADSGGAVQLDSGLQCPNWKPRVVPAAPPPNRLAAGGLDCPRGMVEVPGGSRRTQTKGWSETGTGERIPRPEVLVPQRSFCLDWTEVTRAE